MSRYEDAGSISQSASADSKGVEVPVSLQHGPVDSEPPVANKDSVTPGVRDLASDEYWNKYWNRKASPTRPAVERLKLGVKRLVGESTVECFRRSYADYVVWEKIYRSYLPPMKGAKVLEVGSAPG